MASVLAIISKKAFEKLAPGAKLGDVLPIDSYASSHATLAQLAHGGALFLVTVREWEQLWLVAVLEDPFHEASTWCAQLNAMPVTDITDRVEHLVFESGAGLAAREGALGMSLQTPRVLTDGDIALLRGDAIAVAPPAVETDPMEARLLGMVAAAPDDDGPREVLADWYLERGDIRGEHMQLALRGPDSSSIAGHERLILGEDLHAVTTQRFWDRGLLRSFTLEREDVARADVWVRALHHPWLRIVREIERGKATPARYRMFVARAGALETITIPNIWLFDGIVAQPRPALRHLIIDGGGDEIRARLLADPSLLPGLAKITLRAKPHSRSIPGADVAALARQWNDFGRGDIEITLRVPTRHNDHRDEPVRREIVAWLRAANPCKAVERASGRWHTLYRATMRDEGLALEVVTDELFEDELLTIQSLMPLAQLTITPARRFRYVRDLLDDVWLGSDLRELLTTVLGAVPPERVVLNGAYARLRELAE